MRAVDTKGRDEMPTFRHESWSNHAEPTSIDQVKQSAYWKVGDVEEGRGEGGGHEVMGRTGRQEEK